MEFSPQGISRQTEDIFEKYLQGAVGDEEFEALCAAHPNRAGELRRLRAMRELIATLPRGPVMDALRRQRDSGRDGDAAVGAVEVDHMTSEVMRRLGERTGSFERYRIDGEICSGGQGVVVSAWDEARQCLEAVAALLAERPDEVRQELVATWLSELDGNP
jgi:hypothetical protein